MSPSACVLREKARSSSSPRARARPPFQRKKNRRRFERDGCSSPPFARSRFVACPEKHPDIFKNKPQKIIQERAPETDAQPPFCAPPPARVSDCRQGARVRLAMMSVAPWESAYLSRARHREEVSRPPFFSLKKKTYTSQTSRREVTRTRSAYAPTPNHRYAMCISFSGTPVRFEWPIRTLDSSTDSSTGLQYGFPEHVHRHSSLVHSVSITLKHRT